MDNDEFNRFVLGTPPEKNGDYAFLLHILQSMKSTGKAAVVLPHGVLFRGLRRRNPKNILKKGYIKAIIGMPANLFYGTGIPACIIVLDKENAAHRKGVFMMDASKGFVKDGNKNRLREQDIRKITDVFSEFSELPKYSRMVSITEIADSKNDYNLNIPRYIDTQEAEDIQDLTGHLVGGIPANDIKSLQAYWDLFPSLQADLFKPLRDGYFELKVNADQVKSSIFNHPEFVAFNQAMHTEFDGWLQEQQEQWKVLDKGFAVKESIESAGKSILAHFESNALVDQYAMYQHLMTYWNEVMQDDLYSISLDGWKAGNEYTRLIIKGKRGKDGKAGKDKEIAGLAGIDGRMINPELLIDVFFNELKNNLTEQEQIIEVAQARMTEIEEEQSGEEGLFADLEKVNATEVNKLLKTKRQEVKSSFSLAAEPVPHYGEAEEVDEVAILEEYISQTELIKKANAEIKTLNVKLENEVLAEYPILTEAEIKDLMIYQKWTPYLQNALIGEQDRLNQSLTQRIAELTDRYTIPLSSLEVAAQDAEDKVKKHLLKMGLQW